ncbi:MAG: hypothetical protein AAF383_09940 [Cyanobacteria bacterium P01_A01_bin.83]
MIKTQYFSTSTHKHSDWSFLPSMFSGMAGIVIGLIIGSVLGWI